MITNIQDIRKVSSDLLRIEEFLINPSTAFIKYSETDLVGALKKLDVQKPSDLDEQFPVTAQACTDLEVENVVPM